MANGLTARRVAYLVQNDPRFCAEFLLDYLLLAGDVSTLYKTPSVKAPRVCSGLETMQRSFRLDSDLALAPANLVPASGIR